MLGSQPRSVRQRIFSAASASVPERRALGLDQHVEAPRLRRQPLAKGGRDVDPSKRRQRRLSVSALLCPYSLLAGHADRDAFRLRLLTRCAFSSPESFRDFRGGFFAGHALQKPNVFLRPRSPCRSPVGSRRRFRHAWFSSIDPTYLTAIRVLCILCIILRSRGSSSNAVVDRQVERQHPGS
jgi:hypothetical protein